LAANTGRRPASAGTQAAAGSAVGEIGADVEFTAVGWVVVAVPQAGVAGEGAEPDLARGRGARHRGTHHGASPAIGGVGLTVDAGAAAAGVASDAGREAGAAVSLVSRGVRFAAIDQGVVAVGEVGCATASALVAGLVLCANGAIATVGGAAEDRIAHGVDALTATGQLSCRAVLRAVAIAADVA